MVYDLRLVQQSRTNSNILTGVSVINLSGICYRVTTPHGIHHITSICGKESHAKKNGYRVGVKFPHSCLLPMGEGVRRRSTELDEVTVEGIQSSSVQRSEHGAV